MPLRLATWEGGPSCSEESNSQARRPACSLGWHCGGLCNDRRAAPRPCGLTFVFFPLSLPLAMTECVRVARRENTNMNRFTLSALTTALVGAVPLPALATASATVQSDAVLDPIIITATRVVQSVDASLAAVTVITRDDLENLQAQSLPEVLGRVPGLVISNNGGSGKATSVYMRGTESGHVLVLVDGVRIGSASLGTVSFEQLPLSAVERIEIVRGPRSSLYGSEAIGGVIQIFTRQEKDVLKSHAGLSVGSRNTRSAEFGLGAGNAKGWFTLNAASTSTYGINACVDAKAGCYANEPDKDGFRSRSASLNAGVNLPGSIRLDAQALQANGSSQFDGNSQNEGDTVQQVFGLLLSMSPVEIWNTRLQIGRSHDDADNFKDGFFKSRFNTRRDSVSWQSDIELSAGHLLTAGIDNQHEGVDSTTAYARTGRSNTGVFAQYQGRLASQRMQMSWRSDDNSQFGRHDTAALAWGMDLSPAAALRLGYGTAFKAPTFNELYFPNYGNPALRPSRSNSAEVGLTVHDGDLRWELQVFESRISDLITYDAAIKAANNINRARIRGIEAVLSGRAAGIDLQGSWTGLAPESRTAGANNGKDLPRRPRQTFRVNADCDLGSDWRLGAALNAEGRRFDDLANTIRLPGFATVDLRADYRLAPEWRVQLKLENLLNRDYQTVYNYNQPGRGVFLTLRYQP